MDIITELIYMDEYVNDLTKEMDKHLIYTGGYLQTYLNIRERNKTRYAIRYPGATRGHITLDDVGVITDVVLYPTATEEIACYHPSVIPAVRKFIGAKLVFAD